MTWSPCFLSILNGSRLDFQIPSTKKARSSMFKIYVLQHYSSEYPCSATFIALSNIVLRETTQNWVHAPRSTSRSGKEGIFHTKTKIPPNTVNTASNPRLIRILTQILRSPHKSNPSHQPHYPYLAPGPCYPIVILFLMPTSIWGNQKINFSSKQHRIL
jgi:hypothetical protein